MFTKDNPFLQANLMRAVAENNVQVVWGFLSRTVPSDVAEVSGKFIFMATYRGNIKMVQLLVGYGANLEVVAKGLTPLKLAVDMNDTEMVRCLVRCGASLRSCDYPIFSKMGPEQTGALYHAIFRGNVGMMRLLIQLGAPISEQKFVYNDDTIIPIHISPLVAAVTRGSLDIVRVLFQELGANNFDDTNCLRLAMAPGREEIFKFLLSFVNFKIAYDISNNLAENNNELLRKAATEGDIELLNLLLGSSVVVNNITALENESYRSAFRNGHQDVADRLLEFRAVRNFELWVTIKQKLKKIIFDNIVPLVLGAASSILIYSIPFGIGMVLCFLSACICAVIFGLSAKKTIFDQTVSTGLLEDNKVDKNNETVVTEALKPTKDILFTTSKKAESKSKSKPTVEVNENSHRLRSGKAY